MHEILTVLAKLSILVFVVSAMLGVGAELTPRRIVEPLRNLRLVAMTLLVSYMLVPLLAWGIVRLDPLPFPLRAGLILLSMTAGAEALPKLAQLARGDTPLAVGLMFLQLVLTLAYVPIMFAVLLPSVQLDTAKLVLKLGTLVLLPVAIGLLLRGTRPDAAARVEKLMHRLSSLMLASALILIVGLNIGEVQRIITLDLLTRLLALFGLAFGAGYALGGREPQVRLTLGLAACARNGSIALLVASQAFDDPDVVLTIILGNLVMALVLGLAAAIFRRRSPVAA